jgi:adenosylmethionine---8-amino-7-oxononanoate aminotransferase
MAFQFWFNQSITTKRKVIAIRGAYHGDTFGSMSVGERGVFTAPFVKYLFDAEYIDFPTPGNEDNVLAQFRKLLVNSDVGAFVFEPLVQAAAGMRTYSASMLDLLIEEAHQNNVICIADEVFTGFGRTGKFFASDYLSNMPDIIALSKGLTGGTMALGVTSCSEKIISAYVSDEAGKTFFHGHSYTANPIACAAANASFNLLTNDQCKRQLVQIEKQHGAFKKKIELLHPDHAVRCLGTILAIELKTMEGTSYFNEIRKHIQHYFLSRNILLRPLGNVIYVLPPYIIQEVELSQIYSCIEEFLTELKVPR